MTKGNSAFVISLADVMIADHHVFCSRVESGILDELDSRPIVTVERDSISEDKRRIELGKGVLNPDGLLCGVRDTDVLGFRARKHHDGLLLG